MRCDYAVLSHRHDFYCRLNQIIFLTYESRSYPEWVAKQFDESTDF